MEKPTAWPDPKDLEAVRTLFDHRRPIYDVYADLFRDYTTREEQMERLSRENTELRERLSHIAAATADIAALAGSLDTEEGWEGVDGDERDSVGPLTFPERV